MSVLRKIFVGPNGIRTGWRLLIFFVLAVPIYFGLGWVLTRLVPFPAAFDARSLAAEELLRLVALLAAALIMARIERRRLYDYYWPRAKQLFGGKYWMGALYGAVSTTLLMFSIKALGGYSFGGLAIHGSRILYYGAWWTICMVLLGYSEEFWFRAYPQFTLATGMGFWPAAVVISAVFGGLHYFLKPHERWPDFACTFLLAMFLLMTIQRTGSIAWAAGFHFTFDWFNIFFYSAPNGGQVAVGRLFQATLHGPLWLTGGPLGPEASLLVFPVIALLFLGFHWLYRRTPLAITARGTRAAAAESVAISIR